MRLFFAINLFVLFLASPLEADAKTDREIMGLVGSVRTVFEESSTGKEGATLFGNIYIYDKEGRQTESQWGMYKVGGSINDDDRGNKSIRSYDPKTREQKISFLRSDGSIYGTSVTAYDVGGNIKEHQDYNEDGSLGFRTVYIYDRQGRQTGNQYYRGDGTLSTDSIIEHKIDENGNRVEITTSKSLAESGKWNGDKGIITFDKQGNQSKGVRYNYDGSFRARWRYTYNERGMQTGSFYYNADGSLDKKSTSVYGFDSVGNWIKRTSHDWKFERGKSKADSPFTMIYKRTFTYYESPKPKK